jgi:methionine aminotransferase
MISKLPDIGTTIFATMSKMASEFNAINLAQGFPNFEIDPKLKEFFYSSLEENVHQYAPMAGQALLIDEIINLTSSQYKRKINSTNVLVTAGATQAIFTTIQALVFSGDEVVIIDPAYDCYDPAIILVGAKAIHIPMESDFSIDWNKVESSLNTKTKMIILNNPHNPSGKIFTKEDIGAIKQIILKNPQLYILSDEVYEFITFENKHISMNQIPELAEKSIIVSSFGKTFHITGWKIGYIVAPEEIINEIKKVHQFLVFCVNHVAQNSLANYLKVVDLDKLGPFYKEKRNYFQKLLASSRFKILPSEGSFFQVLDYSEISGKNDVEFVLDLCKNVGVAAIPMSVFYQNSSNEKHLRFCFAKDNLTLEQAAEKLCKI